MQQESTSARESAAVPNEQYGYLKVPRPAQIRPLAAINSALDGPAFGHGLHAEGPSCVGRKELCSERTSLREFGQCHHPPNIPAATYIRRAPGLRVELERDCDEEVSFTATRNGPQHLTSWSPGSSPPGDHSGKELRTASPIPPIPDGGLRAWLTALGSFCTVTAGFGLINSVGVLQSYMERHQLSSFTSRDVAWIPATNVFLCLFLGVRVGPLFDAHGPRKLMLAGSIGYVGGLVAMSFLGCGSCGETSGGRGGRRYALLLVTWGFVCGASAAVLCTTALSVLAHWFQRRRGLASGAVFVGSSVGGVAFPLLMRATLETLGWPVTMRILAGIVALLVTLGNMLIRGRMKGGEGRRAIDVRCFRDWRFLWTTVGISLFEFVLVGSMGLLPTWATAQGFDEVTAFNIVACVNAGSGVGRFVAGAVSDHLGRFNTAILTLLWATLITFAVWTSIGDRIWTLYFFAPLFGFGTGSLISMAPVCIGQLCTADEFGRFYGTSYSVVSFSALLCIPVSAQILQGLGPRGMVFIFGSVLFLSAVSFGLARWACLDHRWKWKTKV
ncbi:MFS monocarboxylate transporter [Pleurostoma richardsiae]|uniref:MFS monocarboxylate transporter n=1 Tax=Pleurostoma richardsiae TaxID=41990 RepID=A0AA38S416_9PEZI|nr:MFS monocarboxylate transporter [Pleurostoma richardsiae]